MATIRAGKFVSDKDLATSTQVAIVLYGQLNIINRFMLFACFSLLLLLPIDFLQEQIAQC